MSRCDHVDGRGRHCVLPAGNHLLHRYGIIPKLGRRAKSTRAELERERQKARRNSAGICQARGIRFDRTEGPYFCSATVHLGVHAHHVWPEDRRANRHDRLLWVCAEAHRTIHLFPLAARRAGLLREEPRP